MMINVLVMSAGSIPGVAVINALKEQDEIAARVVAADMDELSAGFLLADMSHIVPAASDPTFISNVRRICEQESIEVIFPIIDEELQIFADNFDLFRAIGVRVITNPPDVVRVAKDKLLTSQRCAELSVLTPQTVARDQIGLCELPPFPLIVKPRDGRGSVGVYKARDQRELEFFVSYVPNPIVQQFIEGTEYTIDILTDFEGRLLSAVPKERLIVKSGMQTKGRTLNDTTLIEYGASISNKFGLVPRGNIQCIRDGVGKIWLVEINPKFAASLPFTIAAGVNAPQLLLKMHLGQQVDSLLGRFKDNLLMLRIWRELYRQM